MDNIHIYKLIEEKFHIKLNNHVENFMRLKNLGLSNMRKVIKKLEEPEGLPTLETFLSTMEAELQAEKNSKAFCQEMLAKIKQTVYLSDVMVLSVFKKGVRVDEEDLINKRLVHTIGEIKEDPAIKQILLPNNHPQVLVQFTEEWYNFIFASQHEELAPFFKEICDAVEYYICSYIIARIRKYPGFCQAEFQISPFHSIPDEEKFYDPKLECESSHYCP